jgi:hypothetical protein
MSPPERLDDIAAVYAARTWHRTEGGPPVPDPHAPRPDCERHGCSADAGGWVHTDDCKRAFAVAQHETGYAAVHDVKIVWLTPMRDGLNESATGPADTGTATQ